MTVLSRVGLGVPLDAERPRRPLGLDRLGHAVALGAPDTRRPSPTPLDRPGGGGRPPAWGLVAGARARPRAPGRGRTRCSLPAKLPRTRRCPLVAEIVRQVLAQRAAGRHVDELHAAADAEHRQPSREGPARQGRSRRRRAGGPRARPAGGARRRSRAAPTSGPPISISPSMRSSSARGSSRQRRVGRHEHRHRAGALNGLDVVHRDERRGQVPHGPAGALHGRADADQRAVRRGADDRKGTGGLRSRPMMALAYTLVGILLAGGLLLGIGIIAGLWFAVSGSRPGAAGAPPRRGLIASGTGASVRRRAARGPDARASRRGCCGAASSAGGVTSGRCRR